MMARTQTQSSAHIEEDLRRADAIGVPPPQNWTTVAAERILSLRDDAARYRWLRNNPQLVGFDSDYRPDQIDAAIDKARAAQEVAG